MVKDASFTPEFVVAHGSDEGYGQIISHLLKETAVSSFGTTVNHVTKINGKTDVRIVINQLKEILKNRNAVPVITKDRKAKVIRISHVDLF